MPCVIKRKILTHHVTARHVCMVVVTKYMVDLIVPNI